MISIQELKSNKCPGQTSLFISFGFDQNIINILKETEMAVYDSKKKLWELPLNTLAFIIDNLCIYDAIELKFIEATKSALILPSCEYKVKPYKHQEEAIKFLLNNPNSLLCDGMGLGKSCSMIYTCEELYKRGEAEHALIICGINSLKQNWKKEINKFSNLSCHIIGEKISKNGTVSYKSITDRAKELYNKLDDFFIILNIECLRWAEIIDAIKDSKNKFDIIAIDECHLCANKSSQSDGLLKLSKVGKYHYGMTGTLICTTPFNAFIPLKFIGKESTTFSKFKHTYGIYDHQFGHEQLIGYKNLELLQDEINSCSLRRTSDILDLPPKTIIPEYIEMNAQHKSFYENIQAGVIEEADRVEIKNTSLLGLTVRLRQASTCPEVLTSAKYPNAKFERAKDIVNDLISNNEKVVIFSQFKDPIYELAEDLKQYKPLVCTGDQNDADVSDMIDKFQNDTEHMILLGTSQKMGTGVTLNRASYMILLDAPWNASQFNQTVDRIYRIGSKKPVFVYNLINIGTIDERVQKILERKQAISDYLVDNKITEREDLQELLGIRNKKVD